MPRLEAIGRVLFAEPSQWGARVFVEGTVALNWRPFAQGTRWSRAAAVAAQAAARRAQIRKLERVAFLQMVEQRAAFQSAQSEYRVHRVDYEHALRVLHQEQARYEQGRATINEILAAEAAVTQVATQRDLARLGALEAWLHYQFVSGGELRRAPRERLVPWI